MSAMYSSRVGMCPRREQIAASSAEPRYTFVFLPSRFGKLRVDVDITVAPSRARHAEHAVVPFFGQLLLVHLRRRGNPQLDRDVALAFEQLRRRAEVAD